MSEGNNSFVAAVAGINRFILLIEKVILIVLMTSMLIFGFLQVFSRFILKSPIGWSEELLTYSFTWASFIGASMAIYYKSHFSVDLLMKKVPEFLVKKVRLFVWIMICLFSLFILVMGWRLTLLNSIQMMNIIPVSMSWAYLAMPASGLFIFIHAFEKTLEVMLGINQEEGLEE